MEVPSPQDTYETGKKQFKASFIQDHAADLESKVAEERETLRTRLLREATIIYDEALRYFADLESQEAPLEQNWQVSLVQLPETRAQEISERILEAERSYSPNLTARGYDEGSATEPDELKITTDGTTPALLTAEHATAQVRNNKRKGPDWGTGGLTDVLATDHGTFAITTLGKQTGDAGYDEAHPLKEAGSLLIVQENMRLALSIHAMGSGKYVTQPQMQLEKSADIAIGIGRKFTTESAEFAEWLRATASDLELHADINPWYLATNDQGEVRYEDGLPLRNSFRADKERTTRGHFQAAASESGLVLPIAQLELGPDLRVGPQSKSLNFEKIYKAYVLLTEAIKKYGAT